MTSSRGGAESYLRSEPPAKYPVGKVAGTDAHTYTGSHIMHILVQDGDNWTLACNPKKKARYSYRGFLGVVTCQRCRKPSTRTLSPEDPE